MLILDFIVVSLQEFFFSCKLFLKIVYFFSSSSFTYYQDSHAKNRKKSMIALILHSVPFFCVFVFVLVVIFEVVIVVVIFCGCGCGCLLCGCICCLYCGCLCLGCHFLGFICPTFNHHHHHQHFHQTISLHSALLWIQGMSQLEWTFWRKKLFKIFK